VPDLIRNTVVARSDAAEGFRNTSGVRPTTTRTAPAAVANGSDRFGVSQRSNLLP
jgi:hypothetical protein